MNLEKDDLGLSNDTTVDEYGEQKSVYINREVVTIRGILPVNIKWRHTCMQCVKKHKTIRYHKQLI